MSMPPLTKSEASYDGVSIAALVCAAVCCAAPVAVVLGVFGIVRTSRGQRRGRWAAVTGLVLGSVLSLVMMASAVTGVVFVLRSIDDDLDLRGAQPGMCINLDWTDVPNEVSCTQQHEAEIVWAGVMTAELMREWDAAEYIDDFCLDRDLDPRYGPVTGSGSLEVDYEADTLSGEPKEGAMMVCYLASVGGELYGPLRADVDPTA